MLLTNDGPLGCVWLMCRFEWVSDERTTGFTGSILLFLLLLFQKRKLSRSAHTLSKVLESVDEHVKGGNRFVKEALGYSGPI